MAVLACSYSIMAQKLKFVLDRPNLKVEAALRLYQKYCDSLVLPSSVHQLSEEKIFLKYVDAHKKF